MFLSWSFIPLGLWLSRKEMHVVCVGMQSWMGLFDKMGWESVVCAVGQRGNWIIPGWEGTSGNSPVSSELWLGEFHRLSRAPQSVCMCVYVCVFECVHVCVCVCVRKRFACVCIRVHYYVSLEWDTVQSTHCSLCQRVAKLSVSGRRCASAGLFSIVSAARACSPPLGLIQHRAVGHIQKWSFKPGGNRVSSSEVSAVFGEQHLWTPVSHIHENTCHETFNALCRCSQSG